MKTEIEIKKISVDPGTLRPTLSVNFELMDYKDVSEFKKSLMKFQNDLAGQKTLK